MAELKDFYDARVSPSDARNFLKQVGHTEYGQPISAQQFDGMTGQLHDLLDLQPDDRLLDLACGNGVVTARLARDCAQAVGVDLSPRLIELASANHTSANTRYFTGDLRHLADIPELRGMRFSKVLMSAALQHFSPPELEPLLRSILALCTPDPVIVFSFIPEDGKQRHLFNTPRRRLTRAWLRLTGRDGFGHWWRKPVLTDTCAWLGLSCSFHAIDDRLMAASYRFNMRIPARD